MSSVHNHGLKSMQDSLSLYFTPHILLTFSFLSDAMPVYLTTSHFYVTYNSVQMHHRLLATTTRKYLWQLSITTSMKKNKKDTSHIES